MLFPLLEKALAPHFTTLAWQIPWMEESGRLQSMGSLGVGYNWANSLSLFTFTHWRRKWQPTPVFLPGERIPGMGDPGGLPSMGSHRIGHTWSDLAAAAAFPLPAPAPLSQKEAGRAGEAGVDAKSWPLYTGAKSNLRDSLEVSWKEYL